MEKQMFTSFSDQQRTDAMKKYKIIEPYLNKQETIEEISIKNKVPIRTLYRWVQKYGHDGLVDLIRKTRTNFEQISVYSLLLILSLTQSSASCSRIYLAIVFWFNPAVLT